MKLVNAKLVLISLLALVLVHSSVYSMTIIAPGDTWRFFRGTEPPSEPADAWKEPDFNDSDWETGPSGFGYGDNDDETRLLDMQGNYVTVYIRKEFPVSLSSLDPCAVVELVIDYDDGFIAYLNGGDEIKRRHMPDGPATYTTLATSHEAGTPVTIPLGTVGTLLNDGNNVLAIEGHNVSIGSSDFSLIPALRVVSDIVLTENTTWSGTHILEDTVVVPGGIVLNIEPGTVVQMGNGVAIKVYGQLLADGTEAEPIRFTRYGAGTRWKQIMFVEAADSRLAHCIIEYADCEGDHKDYYDDDCDPCTTPPSRTYFQAVVALASHIDIKGCVFQNLPDDGAGGEGDAIAIVSDDVEHPGEASANIRNCEFLSIGQGVHTRYAYVLVEDCFFTDHHGDNDDIDLYGESTPPPLILNNVLINSHDDMINPTKCSAVIIGNVIAGSSDHGVVLRDRCSPVMINNLIYNCPSAGIAVQNQCDALLVNNTIFNCGRGIRFFDHTGRWGPPYCLVPGSGKATVVNCIIWDCPTTFELTNSPYEEDRGSHVTVINCDIEGGQSQMSVSGYSTVTWLEGNINSDPQFADPGSGDFHLKSRAGRWHANSQSWVQDDVNSPCIDTGDPNSDWTAELWPHGKQINMGAFGGTAEASMSSSIAGNIADLNNNDIVNLLDFALFAGRWRLEKHLLPEDLDRNGFVDFIDVAIFSDSWLYEK